MTTLCEHAYAKINLTLDVLGMREDGYHELKSVMQSISLCDEIEIDLGTNRPWKLSCTRQDIPVDETNLAWRAAKTFFDAFGTDPQGLEIRIVKRIPSEAGLGGGSADAGAVLRALNRHYGVPFSENALLQLAAKVGSDVPFCTLCGTAMAQGRGEMLRKLPPMPDCRIVICKPDFSASTPALYRALDSSVILRRPDNDKIEEALIAGDISAVSREICNVFDALLCKQYPQIDEIKKICISCGALASQLTGSGSAVISVVRTQEDADTIRNALENRNFAVFIAKPV